MLAIGLPKSHDGGSKLHIEILLGADGEDWCEVCLREKEDHLPRATFFCQDFLSRFAAILAKSASV